MSRVGEAPKGFDCPIDPVEFRRLYAGVANEGIDVFDGLECAVHDHGFRGAKNTAQGSDRVRGHPPDLAKPEGMLRRVIVVSSNRVWCSPSRG